MNQPSEPQSENKAGRLAFAYCKIATFSLIAGRYALPLAALLSASFFIVGYFQGKKDTRCYLRYPLVAAAFWLSVLAFWIFLQLWPDRVSPWVRSLHP